jgi:AAA+ superfamily predicted ATPase
LSISQWQHANEQYLAQRLAWLRERFADRFGIGEQPVVKPAQNEKPKRAKAAKREPAETEPHTPALEILAARLQLSQFERDVLLLCAAMELDTRLPSMCAHAQGDPSRPFPTFALAMTLLDEPAWDAMSPLRPLRRLRLLEVNQPGATPLTAAALRADERIVNFIKGLNYLDDRLSPLMMPLEGDAGMQLPQSQQTVIDSLIAQLEQAADERALPIVELAGSVASAKQLAARRIAAAFGLELQRLPAELIPADFGEFETLLRLWEREQRLLPLSIYIDAAEIDPAAHRQPCSPLNRFLARVEGLAFLDLPESRLIRGREVVTAEVGKPTPLEQRALWTELTSDADGAAQLSGQFNMNPAEIHRLAQTAGGDRDRLWTACCQASRPRLDSLAQRIDAKATWDDLVLPEEQASQLREICSQVRHRSIVYDDWGFRQRSNRGLGISVLFAGESGTGKTMAAEVIANDLKLDLYRIDLSAVVNKYIGETEKNLKRLFDAADDGGAILLFDEADALFGKRTEVKDSHDRYANLEVNYLLQRMEAYRGLAILATNLKGSLDKAFLRRLRFVVDFPFPDAATRRSIWRRAWPSASPLAEWDPEMLAQLSVTGANISSIALNSAFAVAAGLADSDESRTSAVLSATQNEFHKLQRPLTLHPMRRGA